MRVYCPWPEPSFRASFVRTKFRKSRADSPTTRSLTVNDSGTTTFGGAVGTGNALLSVTTDAAGTTAINANITTTGAVENARVLEYVARMEALEIINPTMHQIYALGQWGVWDRESLFCQHFDEKRHVVDGEIKAHPDYELFLSFDFNVTNTCVLFQFIRNTGKHTTLAHINVLKCYRVGDLVQLCQTIRMEYPGMRYIINGDPAGRSRSALTLGNQSAYQIICTQLNIPDQQLQVMASAPSHFATKVISDLVFQKCVVRISKTYCGVPKQLAYTPSGMAYGDLISDFKEAKVDRLVSLDPWKKKNPDKSHALDAYRYFVFTNFRDIAADYNLSKFGVDGFD